MVVPFLLTGEMSCTAETLDLQGRMGWEGPGLLSAEYTPMLKLVRLGEKESEYAYDNELQYTCTHRGSVIFIEIGCLPSYVFVGILESLLVPNIDLGGPYPEEFGIWAFLKGK